MYGHEKYSMAAAVLGFCNRTAVSAVIAEALTAEQFDELTAAQFHTEFGWVLDLSCRWIALNIVQWDVSTPRAIADCSQGQMEEKRPFWGWNRARHSIVELAILASRVHMLDRSLIEVELNRHQIIVEKTAGPREIAAWELLNKHLSQ